MPNRWATNEQIAEAMKATPSLRQAAALLGYSYTGLRNRVCSSPELSALWDRSGGGPGSRVVGDAEIVAALTEVGSVSGAAKALGVWRGTIVGRRSPEVAAALAKIPDRIRVYRSAALDKRRAVVVARLEKHKAHKAVVEEFRARFELERTAWIFDALEAGLKQAEMGNICGVTRQRVQQVEASLGLSRKAAE